MDPLDEFSFEGFVMAASRSFALRRPMAEVWQRLALGTDECWPDGSSPDETDVAGRPHTVVARLGAGEHRCTVGGARGFRRLLAGTEILEVRCWPYRDEVIRMSLAPLHFGRTHACVDAGYRLRHSRAATPTARAQDHAGRCRARAAAVERQAAERMRQQWIDPAPRLAPR